MKYLMILTIGVCLLIGTVPVMADQAADEAAVRKVMEQVYTTANKHKQRHSHSFGYSHVVYSFCLLTFLQLFLL